MSDVTYVVIGAGLAGARAVEALREDGVDGRIIMIGEEPELPYERPELSKGYLAGKLGRGELSVLEDGWYARHDVEMLLGRTAIGLDPGSRTIRLDHGERVGYDRLLLAMGSAVRHLDVPGADADGVRYLRRARDADAIRAAISAGEPIVVIGGGWIGLEVTAVARSAGVEVTMIANAPAPLAGVLGEEIGQRFADLHRAHGVEVLTGRSVTRVVAGDDAEVRAVELDDGSLIEASTVIAGVGVEPRTELAESAQLPVNDGVLVDSTLRTENPRIWAAGDLAAAENIWVGGRIRVEHFANANDQGSFAGHNMAGSHETWGIAPFFWSDQYDAAMEYHGYADPDSCRVVTRDLDEAAWMAFWLNGDRVAAGMHVNCWDDAKSVKDLVLDGAVVDADRLADRTVDWADVRAG